MPKAILIAVSDGFGGYGDFLFALKLAQQLKKHYIEVGENPPLIHIITQKSGQRKILQLKGDVEFGVQVLNLDELKDQLVNKDIEIGHIIEAPVFSSHFMIYVNEALKMASHPVVPLTMITEYSYSQEFASQKDFRKNELSHLKLHNNLSSGLLAHECGILLSDDILSPPDSESLRKKVDPAIQRALGISNDLGSYQQHSDLFLQYSHDSYSEKNPAEHFLNIHCEFVKGSKKNQDIIMIGKSLERKRNALLQIKAKLINQGYQRIVFYNAETDKEEVLYDSGVSGASYRVIYKPAMSHESMIACTALSGQLIGSTGDQSFGEALSGNRLMVYETLLHKRVLINSYWKAITLGAGQDPLIIETIGLLRNAKNEKQYRRLGELLRNTEILDKLKKSNEALIKKSDLTPFVVREALGWKPNIEDIAFSLLGNDQDRALMLAQKGLISIFTEFDGESLYQLAKESDPEGSFIAYYKQAEPAAMQCFIAPFNEVAFTFWKEVQFNPFTTKIQGLDFFNCLVNAKKYELLSMITHEIKSEDVEKIKDLSRVLQYKNSNGIKNILTLRQDYPQAIQSPAVSKALFLSTLQQLKKYVPQKNTKRELMQKAFFELVKAFDDTVVSYDENALIGLLLLNKKNIESEYRVLSPRKGLFFGSRLYSLYEEVFKDLGVNFKKISPEQEQIYYQALKSLIDKNPDILANQYIMNSLAKQAGVTFPKIMPLISDADAEAILTGEHTPNDPSILVTNKGFYKLALNELGRGGWGIVHAAKAYSLEDDKVKVSEPLAIKRMGIGSSSILDKESRLLKKVHSEFNFHRFKHEEHNFLAMPLFSGIVLDRYLESHQGDSLSAAQREEMVLNLFKNLDKLHHNGVIHNDLKPQNILYDPIEKKMHIIDFGFAEDKGALLKNPNINSGKFNIEYIPIVYDKETNANPAHDVFSVTLSVAEILGVNKRDVVEARMIKSFEGIKNRHFINQLKSLYASSNSLEEALFSNTFSRYLNSRLFEQFINNFVANRYDFSPYTALIGDKNVALLHAMQEKNVDLRPSVEECIDHFDSNDEQHNDQKFWGVPL